MISLHLAVHSGNIVCTIHADTTLISNLAFVLFMERDIDYNLFFRSKLCNIRLNIEIVKCIFH